MAAVKKASSRASKKQLNSADSRSFIEAKVAAFLDSGGEIQQIPRGVSGQIGFTGSRQIKLGNKKDNSENTESN